MPRSSDSRFLSRRTVLAGAVAAGASLLAPGAARAAFWGGALGADDLLLFFDTLALTRRSRDGPFHTWIRKWHGPVTVRAIGTAEAEHRKALAEALDAISDLTGTHFNLSDRRTHYGNRLTVRFRSHASMLRWSGGPVCTASTFGHEGAIHRGRVEVSVRFVDCLRHELMHALGFDNHWTGRHATPRMRSVLAVRGAAARAPDYSELDKAAIGILYDSRLRAGMLRHRALGVAEAIIVQRFESWYA